MGRGWKTPWLIKRMAVLSVQIGSRIGGMLVSSLDPHRNIAGYIFEDLEDCQADPGGLWH